MWELPVRLVPPVPDQPPAQVLLLAVLPQVLLLVQAQVAFARPRLRQMPSRFRPLFEICGSD
jgi:hypothetical protein